MTASAAIPTTEEYLREVSENYEVWASSQYFIRDKTGDLVPLDLSRRPVQQKLGEIERRELALRGKARIYVLKGRQGGVSTDQQARALHLCMYTPGANALTLAHSGDDTEKLFGITRRAVRHMVENFKQVLPDIGRAEAKEVTFPGIDSNFWTGTAGAKRIGRGVTLTRVHGSEFAFWDKPKSVLGSVTPAMIPSGSVIVLETTPDSFESEAHLFWREAVAGENGYVAVFVPWWECDPENYRHDLIDEEWMEGYDDEEQVLLIVHALTLEEIKWRRSMIQELGKLTFMREFPEDAETCWITAGEHFYDQDQIWTLLHQAPAFITKRMKSWDVEYYADQSYEVELPGVKDKALVREDVVIGSDVAEGSVAEAGDRSTFTARSFPSWRLLATFQNKRIEPTDLGDLLFHVGREVYGSETDEALLIVEKNAHGITVLRRLRDLKYPRRSIYHRTPLGKDRDLKTDYMGWVTSIESKPLMLDAGRVLLRSAFEGRIGIPSRACLRDAWSLVDGELTGKDVLVSEILCWLARENVAKRRVRVMKPLYY